MKPEIPSEKDPEIRRTYIGGSDAAAVLGIDPYKSRVAVWMEKTSDYVPDVDPVVTRLGLVLEIAIATEWSVMTGKEISPGGGLVRHPGFDWIGCHPDNRVGKTELLEVKTHGLLNPWHIDEGWGEELTDLVPARVFTQCMHQMLVTGAKVCYVAALITGRGIMRYEIKRDDELCDQMLAAYKKFRDEYWLPQMAPPSESYADSTLLFGKAVEKTEVYSDSVIDSVHAELTRVIQMRKNYQSSEDRMKGILSEYMGEADHLYDEEGDLLATWKNTKSARISPALVRERYPIVAEACTVRSEGRKLLPKKPKKEGSG